MKALVKSKSEKGLWLEEVPKPKISPQEVLIKIKKTAICGTDLHIYHWDAWAQKTIPVPLTIGHEFVGEIVEIGDEVKGLNIGERVSGEGHITCGHCRQCRAGRRHFCRNTLGLGIHRAGCFAEYLSLPASNVCALPESSSISDEVYACLDPLGNAVHTALSFELVGEDVLITGAGPIGVMAAAIAKKAGARFVVVTDINEYRLEIAKKMGATLAINPQKMSLKEVMKNLDMKEGFDIGLEMSGNLKAFSEMLEVMNHGGRIAMLGIPETPITIDWNQIIFKGLILKGIYGREMFDTWYKMIALLQSGLDISPVLTHRFPYQHYQKAFEILDSGQSGKVVLEWS